MGAVGRVGAGGAQDRADHGNTFYVIPAAELANWQKATAGLPDEWVKDVSAKGNDGNMPLQSVKDLIKKYEKVK